MKIAVPKESAPGERRVSLVPGVLPSLTKAGLDVAIEAGAGLDAGFPDEAYEAKGARIVSSRPSLFQTADVVLQVRTPAANLGAGQADLELLRSGHILIGFSEPLSSPEMTRALAERQVTTLGMELMPRITRAQSMDALSSMATVVGYKAVLLAATSFVRMFPMMMTAAGTIAPARVFVIGAGVAGLQAIATARRLGAVVHAYDLRPAVREQVESLGARFVELPIEASDAEDKSGYAKAQGEDFYRRQRELLAQVLAASDVIITTAVVPGRKAPILITGDMVRGMAPGSLIVDLAAERGGNCEVTRLAETVVYEGVTILGPADLSSTVPYHASQMYAKNISTFLLHLVRDGAVTIDREDEITRETLVTQGGEIVHPRVRQVLGLPEGAATEGRSA